MFGVTFQACHQRQHLLFIMTRRRNEFRQRRAAVGQRSGFIENGRPASADRFQNGGILNDDFAPGGQRYARSHGDLATTHSVAQRLVRLPLWYGMRDAQDRVIEATLGALER